MEDTQQGLENLILPNQPQIVNERTFSVNKRDQIGAYLETVLTSKKAWVKVTTTNSGLIVQGGEHAMYMDQTDPKNPVWKPFPQTNEHHQHPTVQMPHGHTAGIFLRNNHRAEGQVVNIQANFVPGKTSLHPKNFDNVTVTTSPKTVSLHDDPR